MKNCKSPQILDNKKNLSSLLKEDPNTWGPYTKKAMELILLYKNSLLANPLTSSQLNEINNDPSSNAYKELEKESDDLERASAILVDWDSLIHHFCNNDECLSEFLNS